MGHSLYEHAGACAHLHGHNYVALVTFDAKELDQQGMVVDFGVVKTLVSEIIGQELDHRFLVYQMDPRTESLQRIDPKVRAVPFNPTAENIAAYLKKLILSKWDNQLVSVAKIQLWETSNCYAEV